MCCCKLRKCLGGIRKIFGWRDKIKGGEKERFYFWATVGFIKVSLCSDTISGDGRMPLCPPLVWPSMFWWNSPHRPHKKTVIWFIIHFFKTGNQYIRGGIQDVSVEEALRKLADPVRNILDNLVFNGFIYYITLNNFLSSCRDLINYGGMKNDIKRNLNITFYTEEF